MIALYRDGRYERVSYSVPGRHLVLVETPPPLRAFSLDDPPPPLVRRTFYKRDVQIDYNYWREKWGPRLARLIRIEDSVWVEDDDGPLLDAFLAGWTRGLGARVRLAG